MAELVLKSRLSIDEIDKNFEDIDFFDGLIEGLEEALAYQKGSRV